MADATKTVKFFLTRSSPATSTSLIAPDAGIAGRFGEAIFSGGELVFSTYNGLENEFSHWSVNVYIFDKVATQFGLVLAQISVPRITAVDGGSFYCAMNDGTSKTSFGNSAPLTISVVTRSSSQRNRARNKMAEYSMALFTAYKLWC